MKSVFFDFDGTITYKSPNIWKALWQKLGYDVSKESYYAELYRRFLNGEYNYQTWCDLTCDAFIKKDMAKSHLNEISTHFKTIYGLEETLIQLKKNGFRIHIVSGCIIDVIKNVLGKKVSYFDSINANELVFDENDKLTYINGTNYDFEGKAKFIKNYINETGSTPDELYFVGNSSNDEWAHESGCHTICINPENTCSKDSTKWHKVYEYVDDLTEILPALNIKPNNISCDNI